MINPRLSITLLTALISLPTQAQQSESQQLSGTLLFGSYSGHLSADADIDNMTHLTLMLNYDLGRYWGIQAGINRPYQLETSEQSDNAGEYQMRFNTRDLLLGLSGTLPLNRNWALFGSAGWLRYDMDIELEESFYDYKPSGTVTADDNGNGYYATLGARYQLSDSWYLDGRAMHFQRQDILGDSRQPLDLSTTGAAIGATLYFY